MTRSADLIQSNSQVYRIYSRRLSNPADPDIYIAAARKLTNFLSDQRAYYAEAQQPIVDILEIACNSLKNVAPNVFSNGGSLDLMAIPADKVPLFDAFNKLAKSVTPYLSHFTDPTVNNRLVSLLSSTGILLPGRTTDAPPPDIPTQISATPSTRRQADRTASQAQTPSPEIMALGLPSTAKAATGVQPTTLPTSTPVRILPLEGNGNDNGANGAIVQRISKRRATQSPVGELRAHVSDVINPARVERNRTVSAPVPSLSTPSMSSPQTDFASPVSILHLVPQLSQKFPDSTSVTPLPTSADLASQSHNLRSMSPGQVGAAQVSQSPSIPTSTSSGQNEPKPPRRRQSSGLDFLQLDLQVARQKKLMAAKLASGAQKSGATQASPDAVPPSIKDGPAIMSPTTATADIPNTPSALTSPPTVPAATPTTPTQTPETTKESILAITTSMANTTSQPQIIQTPSPTLVHRDLRPGSSRVRTSGSPRKLRITDRAPAPAPEPGSSSAPIVIDEEDVPMSTPADESIDVDAPMQPRTQTDETPMVLDSDIQNMQGSSGDAKDDHKSQDDQKGKALPEQQDDKPSGVQLVQSKDQGKAAEDSVDGLGPSNNNDIMSGAPTVPSLGSESPVLGGDSTHTAAGVVSAPKGKDTEMTLPALTNTTVTSEPSAASDHPTAPAQSVVVMSSSTGIDTLAVQPQEEKGDSETSVGPSLPMEHAASQTPSISSGKASVPTPLSPPAASHSSIVSLSEMDISPPSGTPPIVLLKNHALQSRSTPLSMGHAARQTPSITSGRASAPTPLAPPAVPHSSIGSLSDMDISDAPPIVFLKNRTSHSRSTSPQSGTEPVKAEEIEEDASEMVDELAPLFGKEMKVICMSRAYDVPGEFTFDFTLSHPDWNRVSQWAKAPENLDLEISHARCITLACYLLKELDPYATQDSLPREQWFENVKPVPWENLPKNLWALINDEVSAVFPPYLSPDDLFDLSPYLRVGHNRISFTQIDGMAEYVLVVHGHLPTRGQLVPLKARWDQERRFREQLTFLSRPFIMDDW